MKTWTINYDVQLSNETPLNYQFSVTQRFPPSTHTAKRLARNHVTPILDSRRALTGITINWIVHTAQ